MSARLSKFIESAEALDAEERELAALALQQIDPDEQAVVDRAWNETARRRLDEVRSGAVEPVSGTETIRIARDRTHR